MDPSISQDHAWASSSGRNLIMSEQKEKYDDYLKKFPAMRSITEAPIFEDGRFYKQNSAENPQVISDDDDNEEEHPPVTLRDLVPADKELPWDAPTMIGEAIENNLKECSDETSTISSSESRTTDYSTDGGFVVDDGPHDVFLHNHDPDFEPGSAGTQFDDDDSVDDDTDGGDDEKSDEDACIGSPPAKKNRRGSADFCSTHHKEMKITNLFTHITH